VIKSIPHATHHHQFIINYSSTLVHSQCNDKAASLSPLVFFSRALREIRLELRVITTTAAAAILLSSRAGTRIYHSRIHQ
jgi:hypothetical protein